jgi:catechol O-methyltransferase
MRGSPTKILEAIDEFAAKEDFLINIGEHKGQIVADIIASEKPKIFVELGGYLGYSAIFFADAMRKYESTDAKLQYWSLEFDPLFASIAMNLVDLAGLSNIVKVVVGAADDSLRRLNAEGELKCLDMLFLDHVEDLYHADFLVCESLGLLRAGSTIIADNVVRPGAPEYRKFVRSHPGLESKGIKGLIMPGEFEVRCADTACHSLSNVNLEQGRAGSEQSQRGVLGACRGRRRRFGGSERISIMVAIKQMTAIAIM